MRADKQLNVVCCKCGQSHSGQKQRKIGNCTRVLLRLKLDQCNNNNSNTTLCVCVCVCVLTRIRRPFGEIQLTVHTV